MRRAATIARFSIRVDAPLSDVSVRRAVDHSPLGGRGDIGPGVAASTTHPGWLPGCSAPGARTRSSSDQSGRQRAGTAAARAGSHARPSKRFVIRRSCVRILPRGRMGARYLYPQLGDRRMDGPWARHEDRIRSSHLRRTQATVGFAQSPTCAIATDGTPDLPAHSEACPCWAATWHPQEHKRALLLSPALLKDRLDFAGVPEAGGSRKSECPNGSAHNRTARP